MSEFKFFDKGRKDTILLIPGWASDYRIFGLLSPKLNCLVPITISVLDFEQCLLQALETNGLKKISILGWSMGVFLANDFLLHNPDKVDKAVLVSAQKRYKKDDIEKIKILLKKNRRAFLYKFYNDCFYKNEKDSIDWFKKNLLRDYLNKMSLDSLLEGLDYLLQSEITPQCLRGIDIKLVHGRYDKIAPIEEAQKLKDDMPQAKFIYIENSGHMPFLNPSFGKMLND